MSVKEREHEEMLRRERLRKQYIRMWKRRMLGVLQALCGLALVLLPMCFLRSSKSVSEAAAPLAVSLPPAPSSLPYEEIVWQSVGRSCAAPPRGHR